MQRDPAVWADGRTRKFVTVEDEYIREALAIEVERSLSSTDLIETLRYQFEVGGARSTLTAAGT